MYLKKDRLGVNGQEWLLMTHKLWVISFDQYKQKASNEWLLTEQIIKGTLKLDNR